jgi:hypothetical protein
MFLHGLAEVNHRNGWVAFNVWSSLSPSVAYDPALFFVCDGSCDSNGRQVVYG